MVLVLTNMTRVQALINLLAAAPIAAELMKQSDPVRGGKISQDLEDAFEIGYTIMAEEKAKELATSQLSQ